MKTDRIAKAALFDPDGNILLLRRSATDPRRPGEWDLPGGGIEYGEDITAGVIREIQEEAGISLAVVNLQLLYAATEPFEAEAVSNTRCLFAGRVSAEQAAAVALSDEHDQFRWIPLEQALEDFQHWFYNPGLRYAVKHQLL